MNSFFFLHLFLHHGGRGLGVNNEERIVLVAAVCAAGKERRIDMASPLQEKSKAFALEIIRLCKELRTEKKERVLTDQLLRSGTSIGANVREAAYAHSKADFIAKLQIALKECAESEYWLELLLESGYCGDREVLERCGKLRKMLVSSINTAKEKSK